MTGRGRGRGRGGGVRPPQRVDPNSLTSPVQKMFAEYSIRYDNDHDTRERIYKTTRDVTIESKRIIFLLHRIGEGNKEEIFEQAADALHVLKTEILQKIVTELSKHKFYFWKYNRWFSFGFQEYIEGLSFLHYLKTNKLITKEEIEKELVFDLEPVEEESEESSNKKRKTDPDAMEVHDDDEQILMDTRDGEVLLNGEKLEFKLSYNDYMLGILDLGGELMRYATNNVTNPTLRATTFQVCRFLQKLDVGFMSLDETPREMRGKIEPLKQSLLKVEKRKSYILALIL
jgi:predicted translin family RNA/ssDNA-binding protein